MNEKNIRKYAALMEELGLTALELSQGEERLRLERSLPGAMPAGLVNLTNLTPDAVRDAARDAAATGEQKTQSALGADTGDDGITSPLVGVFYAAPAEDAPPFVREGDAVKKGQVLGIIEAMKLMNEVTAEHDGVITRVCAANGQIVEYGTELFRIRRSAHE